MADNSKIEWTDATWTPDHRVQPWSRPAAFQLLRDEARRRAHAEPLVASGPLRSRVKAGPVWNGEVGSTRVGCISRSHGSGREGSSCAPMTICSRSRSRRVATESSPSWRSRAAHASRFLPSALIGGASYLSRLRSRSTSRNRKCSVGVAVWSRSPACGRTSGRSRTCLDWHQRRGPGPQGPHRPLTGDAARQSRFLRSLGAAARRCAWRCST